MDSSTITLCPGPIPIEGVSCEFFLLPSFVEIPLVNANSVDPDQTRNSAANDLGLHCCQWNARIKWVN